MVKIYEPEDPFIHRCCPGHAGSNNDWLKRISLSLRLHDYSQSLGCKFSNQGS